MPHVTFIHGIANKPPKDKLLEEWEQSLASGGLDLASEGVSTSMVYWADVMYAAPETSASAHESVDAGLGTAEDDDELAWVRDLSGDEAAMVDALRAKLSFDSESPEADDYTPPPTTDEATGQKFEAIPLPWFIKRRLMKALLRDVHHYLFNTTHEPRAGEAYAVQTHIRKLFLEQLEADAAANDGRHVVVSHSMGTVISYDCLKNVPRCRAVDAYMTVGCPLGLSEVHDNFDPDYKKRDAYPSAKVGGDWVNVYDRLDPVCFDVRLANDYQKDGQHVVVDQKVKNSGPWHHSAWKYFAQTDLCEHLRTLLEL